MVGGEWLDWRAGNLSSEVEISPIQAAISGVWEDILLANVPRLNCDILNVEQLKFWNNTIQPWRGAGDGENLLNNFLDAFQVTRCDEIVWPNKIEPWALGNKK